MGSHLLPIVLSPIQVKSDKVGGFHKLHLTGFFIFLKNFLLRKQRFSDPKYTAWTVFVDTLLSFPFGPYILFYLFG